MFSTESACTLLFCLILVSFTFLTMLFLHRPLLLWLNQGVQSLGGLNDFRFFSFYQQANFTFGARFAMLLKLFWKALFWKILNGFNLLSFIRSDLSVFLVFNYRSKIGMKMKNAYFQGRCHRQTRSAFLLSVVKSENHNLKTYHFLLSILDQGLTEVFIQPFCCYYDRIWVPKHYN